MYGHGRHRHLLCREVTETWYIPGRFAHALFGVFRTILIDRETGLRALRTRAGTHGGSGVGFLAFRSAGAVSARRRGQAFAAAFGPGCGQTPVAGTPPRVISPKEGVIYQRRLSSPETTAIALTASADADARAVFWFVKERFIGRAAPGETLLWQPGGRRA